MGCGLWGGREGLFVPEQPRFGIALWYHLDNVAWAWASLATGQEGEGAPGHTEELPPSCCLAPRGGWGPLGGMSWALSADLVNQELAPFHGRGPLRPSGSLSLPQITPGRV